MLTIRIKPCVKLAMFCLEEAVLAVLADVREEGRYLRPKDIAEALGIKTFLEEGKSPNYSVVTGILWELERKGLVAQDGRYGPWCLLDKELDFN